MAINNNSNRVKKFEKAGYSIHFDRFRDMRCDISAIRTHKFKCKIPRGAENSLCEKFEGVAGVVGSSDKGSLLWFLVQLYGLGFLFVSKEGSKNALLNKLYGRDSDELEISSDYRDHIQNKEALAEFLTKSPRNVLEAIKDDLLPQSIIKGLVTIFCQKESKIDTKKLPENSVLKRAHDGLLDLARKRNRLSQGDIQEFFGIKIDAQDTGGTTFVIQEIPLADLKKNAVGIEIYDAYFRCLLPASQKTGYDIQSLAGVSENQNALSNLFGKSLKAFQNSYDECRRLLSFGNPDYLKKHPEILDFLANAVHRIARDVNSSATSDFIADNWGEYRNLVGGRLQGWLSNFQNRLKLFEEALSDGVKGDKVDSKKVAKTHKEVFEEIKNSCDWRRVFPPTQRLNFEKLCELRASLAKSLKAIKGEIKSENKQKDFGTLLNEYNVYLQGFREFLMKWSNEGIPENFEDEDGKTHKIKIEKLKKGDAQIQAVPGEFEIFINLTGGDSKKKKSKKNFEEQKEEKSENLDQKVIGYWSSSFVPSVLDRYPRFIGQAQKDPQKEIDNARKSLFMMASEAIQFVREIRKNNAKDKKFSAEKWLKGKRGNGHGLFHKNLDTLRGLASRFDETKIEKSHSFKFLQKFVDPQNSLDDEQNGKWQKKNLSAVNFFVSGYEYRNKNFLAAKEVSFDDYLKIFEEHFRLDKVCSEADLKNWLGFQGDNISWFTNEFGEVLKIYLSLLLRDLDKKIELPTSLQDFHELKKTTLASLLFDDSGKMKSGNVDVETVRGFFASSIGSEIRSKISILSRKNYLKRNVIQITNGAQTLLRYVPIEWGNFDHLSEKSRKKICRNYIKRKTYKTYSGFSEENLEILKTEEIKGSTSAEIAAAIWKNFSTQNNDTQRKLAQILGEMPHRWEVVLKTEQPINGLDTIESGLLLEKSNKRNVFNFCLKKTGYLHSLPIQTSVYQKQFLDKFLWGDKKGVLTEKIMGASVIIEQIIDIKTGLLKRPKNSEENFSLYCAIPFQFAKEEGEKNRFKKEEKHSGKYRLSTNDHENVLGIDLGEYGFGWALFDPVTQKFGKKGFVEIPLLQKMRDGAANWKDAQASGIFSRPTTYLADIREQAAGQIRNQIHHLAITHKAKPVYEDSVDGFESGGQRVSKLYKTLKTSDVISGVSNSADEAVRSHFWGNKFVQIGGVIGAAKTSQTCRKCGKCATHEVRKLEVDEVEIVNKVIIGSGVYCDFENGKFSKKEVEAAVKKAQRFESEEEKKARESGKKFRGTVEQFECQMVDCYNVTDADAQAAQNIALKFYLKSAVTAEEKELFQTEDGNFSTLRYFLAKSKDFLTE